MNLRKLKRALPKGAHARRDGNEAVIEMGGETFRVDRKAGWSEDNLAQYLQSKLPVATLKGPHGC
jgi:hypothetical protein